MKLSFSLELPEDFPTQLAKRCGGNDTPASRFFVEQWLLCKLAQEVEKVRAFSEQEEDNDPT